MASRRPIIAGSRILVLVTGNREGSLLFPWHAYPAQFAHDTGPVSDNWQVTDQLPPQDVLHGPCRQRKPLSINAELRVVGKSATTFMTMDSTDSSVSSTFRLSWRKC
ncbi:DUF4360 domain-containing protein [Kibdelosporangium philippinense]|uniref:DUF4360 domain-containing protein n=1 Tax=Kibdelosporangium philippinense TaxID=211113 RepID=UPI003610DBBF